MPTTINIPCTAVILPTKGELADTLMQLASSEIQEVRDALDDLEDVLGDFPMSIPNPLYDDLSVPEIEWERKIQAIQSEYHIYVQTKILEVINKVVSVDFEVSIGGLNISVLNIWSDPDYITTIKNSVCENIDVYYELVPEHYRTMNGRFGLDSHELKCDVAWSYIMSLIQSGALGLIKAGIGKVIDEFKEIWDELGFSTFSEDLSFPPDIPTLLSNIIDDETKDIREQIDELKNLSLASFTLRDLIGGDLENHGISIDELDMQRLLEKIQDFESEWPTYLYKKYLETIAKFLDAVGLGKVLDFIIFDFCDFLELIGMPKQITLESIVEISALSNSSVASLPTISSVSVDRSGSLRYIATEGQTVFSGPDMHGTSGLNTRPRFLFVNGRKKIPGEIPSSEAYYNEDEQSITLSTATKEGDSIFILD